MAFVHDLGGGRGAGAGKPAVSAEVMGKWQGIVDLMARTVGVPAALITRNDPPAIEIFVASASAGNPYHKGGRVVLEDKFKMYCQVVMAERRGLYLPDARRDADWGRWEGSPDVGLGMTCYLGFPVVWPDGEVFGTICVMDRRDNPEVARYEELVRQFGRVVEDDLRMLVTAAERERAVAELREARAELERRVEERTAELRRVNARVAEVLESVTDAFVALDREWRFTYVNEQVARNLGRSREELIGRNIWELFPEEVGGEAYKHLSRAMGERVPVRYEYFVRRVGRWFESHVYPTQEGVSIYSHDITPRKRAEEEARRANAKVKEILESITDAFVALDGDWRFTYVNERAAQTLGRSRGELVGQNMWELIPEMVGTEAYRLTHEAMAERRPVHYENFVPSFGRWYMTHAYPTKDGGLAVYGSDITDRKEAERAMLRAKQVAEDANRAKDQFIAVLSHELRTPLTPVLGAVSEWERKEDLPGELRDDLRMLRRNVELEARLIDDLLDSTRLMRGKVELHRDVTDLHDCIQRVLETSREEARRKGVSLVVNLQAREHHAWADGGRVQQVFWNLINNAIKFTPEGGTVRLESASEGGKLRVTVSDTGIGIEPGELPRLFRPFEQAEQTKARRFGGLGLGLTIAKSLVELHGGRLTASSVGRGKGATFMVELSTSPPKPKAVTPAPVVGAVGPGAGHWRILLVEDDPDTMRIMSRLLKRLGYEVDSADSVRAALEKVGKGHYDLLISDLGLPDGSGLEVMRQAKGQHGLKGLAISGYGTEDDLRQSLEAGFQRLLVKPVNFGALEAAVRQMAV